MFLVRLLISILSLSMFISYATECSQNTSWAAFRLLLDDHELQIDKKYKGAIEAMGIEYLDCSRYAEATSKKMPIISCEQLVLHERYYYERYHYYLEQKWEAPWYMKFISDTVGHGIFAAADIKKGDYIGDYTGILYDIETLKKLSNYDPHYSWSIHSPFNSGLNITFFVDAKYACNFTRFINHSFNPNVQGLTIYAHDGWHMIYVACKDIKKDEQMLVNYGQGYWQHQTPEILH